MNDPTFQFLLTVSSNASSLSLHCIHSSHLSDVHSVLLSCLVTCIVAEWEQANTADYNPDSNPGC